MQRRRPQNENRSGELGVQGQDSWDNTHSRMHQSGRLTAVRDEAPAGITHTYTDACQSRRMAAELNEASWWRGSRHVGLAWTGHDGVGLRVTLETQGWKREARVRVEQKDSSVIKDLSYQRVRNITQATGEYNRK